MIVYYDFLIKQANKRSTSNSTETENDNSFSTAETYYNTINSENGKISFKKYINDIKSQDQKVKITAQKATLDDASNDLLTASVKKNNDEINIIKDLSAFGLLTSAMPVQPKEVKINNGIKLNEEEKKQIESENSIVQKSKYLNEELEKSKDKFSDGLKNINKSSIFPIDFDFNEFKKNLKDEELLALGSLLLNGLILNYIISIIFVLYGDYLIKRFNLETRFPKLSKFIQLRRKLQNFYLKISIT